MILESLIFSKYKWIVSKLFSYFFFDRFQIIEQGQMSNIYYLIYLTMHNPHYFCK